MRYRPEHRFIVFAHLEAVGVVDQAVKYTVGDGRVTDLLVQAHGSPKLNR